jgi:hypothetical protein
MAWETRKGSRSGRYYTRSRRQDGRVVREYVGSGAAAAVIARHDAQRRAEQELAAAQAAEAQAVRDAYYARLFGPLDVLEVASAVLIRQTLTAAGYRQHDRGDWRKPRAQRDTAE